MAKHIASMSAVKRLARYYRFLGELEKENVQRVSSGVLAARMGLSASQIRQDLNCFGGFGQQGYGYNVNELRAEIAKILGLKSGYKAILIGVGNLGRAIAVQMPFDKSGFSLIGLFDKKESMAGQLVNSLPVRHISGLDDFCRANTPDVAILCTPESVTKELSEQLIKLGIKGFWNFSHYDINVEHPEIPVENVHLSDSLMTFCYRVKDTMKK